MNIIERPSRNGHGAHFETNLHLGPRRGRKWLPAVVALGVAIALIVATVVFVRLRSAATIGYDTVPVVRQDLVASVTATGTVNPQNTIAVGTQVSGTISELDADYNSHVHRGQVLAKIDPQSLQAALDQAQGALAQAQNQARAAAAAATGAQAGIGSAAATQQAAAASAQAAGATAAMNEAAIASAAANVAKSRSALDVANQTVERDRALFAHGYIAQSQLDADTSAAVAAQSALSAAQIAVSQAQDAAAASRSEAVAGNSQTAASSYAAQTNLQHTIITSPVDGTVVARDVSIGQTVAASLQTPTLFSIAQDLNKMEVDLAVGEPDIGNVRPGATVHFSVLAYPSQTFTGTVSQVRINPTTQQNVVTYTTVVLVDNEAGKLLPGMTANASIDTAKAAASLVVPSVALGYSPALVTRHSRLHAGSGANATSPWGATNASAPTAANAGSTGRVYVVRNGKLARIPVAIALVSGTQAAVTPLHGAQLTAGDAVVTGDSQSDSARSTPSTARAAANPLAGSAAPTLRGIR